MIEFIKRPNHLSLPQELSYYIPLDQTAPEKHIFNQLKDGVVFCLLLNAIQPQCIDLRYVNIPKADPQKNPLNKTQVYENFLLVLSTAQSLGISTIQYNLDHFIDASKNYECVKDLLLHLIDAHVDKLINYSKFPELIRLQKTNEDDKTLEGLTSEMWLTRWINHTLGVLLFFFFFFPLNLNTNWSLLCLYLHSYHIENIDGDQLSENSSQFYVIFAFKLFKVFHEKGLPKLLQMERDGVLQRIAGHVNTIDVQVPDLKSTDRNLHKLILAHMFMSNHGLKPLTEQERIERALDNYKYQEEFREHLNEIEALIHWIRSLVPDEYFKEKCSPSQNFFVVVLSHMHSRAKGDLMNGILLLKILDRIHPGSVNWMKVKIAPKNKWDSVLNCNLVVEIISNEPFDLKTTNIGGVDIADGKLKAILSITGQIQRYFMIKTLKELKFAGKYVTDDQIREWSNSIALQSPHQFSQPIKKWNDRSLSTGLYFLDLLAVLDTSKTLFDPVQFSCFFPLFVLGGQSNSIIITKTSVHKDFSLDESSGIDEAALVEKKKSNISAAITLTRKLGGILFVHMEDLIEAKSQATLTIVATILAVGLRMGNFARSFEQRVSVIPKDIPKDIPKVNPVEPNTTEIKKEIPDNSTISDTANSELKTSDEKNITVIENEEKKSQE
ncbi:hypothetical protein RFI_27148 [Reticulomyxa filosa]|uniref:Calponin-homology (CH) domain-containing protein n=1 Tax=Reticulomyxa filosa TaxID=46433 RepID=X6MB19_RETFI|nr:hypothetical protein RFI_27148 [Reticulomyxa filosa]|eukprot:ETO10230.1 hypothetical protein RFI_27148 [Reticulomyxa filosa]